MTVQELIDRLLDYNQNAKVTVIVHNKDEEFTLSFGGGDGCTRLTCDNVGFYVDRLCDEERNGNG